MNETYQLPSATRSGKRKILRWAWVSCLCLFIIGMTILGLFAEKTTWIDANGRLHEPLFGLVPTSFFFLSVALLLAILDFALRFIKPR
ncbi:MULTISPECIES: DUF3955 domain-containing protein [unclassified Undibacterium]|nr:MULTISPECIES: DUF3955 domain-containing protein [unclassified Undibacterium]MEB0215675.1 DUF3955 domain-containing protein [Undibacterium sp. 5I2]WPX42953.1 DUF3955 domain-containing protein [Undibacterium sp. CCC3.4]